MLNDYLANSLHSVMVVWAVECPNTLPIVQVYVPSSSSKTISLRLLRVIPGRVIDMFRASVWSTIVPLGEALMMSSGEGFTAPGTKITLRPIMRNVSLKSGSSPNVVE